MQNALTPRFPVSQKGLIYLMRCILQLIIMHIEIIYILSHLTRKERIQ